MTNKPSGFLFDLDGVFYTGGQAIAGAMDTLDALHKNDIPYCFITNTTTRPASALVEKLAGFGIQVDVSKIMTAPMAAAAYLSQKGKSRCRLILDPSLEEDFEAIELDDKSPEYIVIGDIGEAWDYKLMNSIFGQVMEDAKIIALHKGRFWKTQSGVQLDIGAFVAGLEYATGCDALVMGKPTQTFFEMALNSLELEANQVAIVGDDIDSDIGGGQAAGLTGILVKTGKYRESYVQQSNVKPDAILDSIAVLPEWLGLE